MLGHGLDDEQAVGEVAHVGREGDPRVEGVVLLLGQLAAGEGPARRAAEHLLAVLDPGLVDLDGDDVDPVAGEHLHDARTHGAESDHTDAGEVHVPCGRSSQAPTAAVTPRGRDTAHPHQSWPAATSSASRASRCPERSGVGSVAGLDPRDLAQLEQEAVVGGEGGAHPHRAVRGVAGLDPPHLGLEARSSRAMSTDGSGSGTRARGRSPGPGAAEGGEAGGAAAAAGRRPRPTGRARRRG